MLRSKVIMTSALDEASFDSNLASDDYDDYICKPIDIMQLNDKLKKLDIIK
jgi:two-component system chemotaxis response regulator CheY